VEKWSLCQTGSLRAWIRRLVVVSNLLMACPLDWRYGVAGHDLAFLILRWIWDFKWRRIFYFFWEEEL